MLRLLPLALALLIASHAAALTLLDDRRFLRAEEFTGTLGDCGTLSPSQPFQPWTASQGCLHGGVEHESTAEAGLLRGADHLETTGGGFDVDVESRYEIDFSVGADTLVRIDFDLSFSIDGEEGPGLTPETMAGLLLLRDGVEAFAYEASFTEPYPGAYRLVPPTSGVHRATLDPGATYTFSAWLRSHRQPNALADFSYSLTEVPEPDSAPLVGLGAIGLAAWRRRRTRARVQPARPIR